MKNKWSLALDESRSLEVQTGVARVSVVPTLAGEKPWLEIQQAPQREGSPEDEGPSVEIDEGAVTTRVRISGIHLGSGSWWNGPWWDASFWDAVVGPGKRFWKKAFGAHVILHVPADVRGVLRSNAAKMHVERLSNCDLSIETEAGALSLQSVSGRLHLATQAGRIDARAIGGSLDIATSAGAVQVEVTSLAAGTHHIRTNVGAVRIELARGIPVRIAARTSMGATRIDYPITQDAPALLDIEADVGAIRVVESLTARDVVAVPSAGPYRSSVTAPPPDDEIERILTHVADGRITAEAARDLLRELGVT